MPKAFLQNLNEVVSSAHIALQSMPKNEQELTLKPNGWTKKQILGHLCDSAFNNYHRFVCIQFMSSPFKVSTYQQESWVKIGAYNNRDWNELLQLWYSLNTSIYQILYRVGADSFNLPITGDTSVHNFQELIEDYKAHLVHHLSQLLR